MKCFTHENVVGCLDVVELQVPEPLPREPPHEGHQHQPLVEDVLRQISCSDQLRPPRQLPHTFLCWVLLMTLYSEFVDSGFAQASRILSNT